jgi:L-threonylcarbamoyladenylate synthase
VIAPAHAVARAAQVLRDGGLVAFPTETVYGLGANALDADAVRGIFAAKGRPSFNPLIAHVASPAEARRLVRRWPEAAERLVSRYWPGPLTVVVPRADVVPDVLTAGLDTVALRLPAHPVARALVEAAGTPIAAPSANRFTEVSPTTAEHVARALGGRVDLILDAGPTTVGIESTVVDLSGPRPVLLRPGSIPPPEIEALVGALLPAPEVEGTASRRSPGLVKRHYAPRAELRVYREKERAAMERDAREAAGNGRRAGALLLRPLDAPVAEPVAMPGEPAGYARELYAALHRLDELGCDLVLVDEVPDGPAWEGVRDRLARAAHRG